jgi:hypothetical protein
MYRCIIVTAALAATLAAAPGSAQNRGGGAAPDQPNPTTAAPAPTAAPSLAGKWTYRSYINTPQLVDGDPNKAVNVIFGEGVYTFETLTDTSVKGTLDMGGGFFLDLAGTVQASPGGQVAFQLNGFGRAGTPTDGWEYDYNGVLAYHWPNGVDQVPSVVGSVIRAKPHDGAPAGFVASFIAVRQP